MLFRSLSVQAVRWVLDRYRPVAGSAVNWQGPAPLWSAISLLLLPVLTYWAWWQPYLWVEQQGFLEIHRIMQSFHTQQVGANDHPYCSAWYQWPWQIRPMSYLFDLQPVGEQMYRVIHQLGNPLLYPLSLLAVLYALGALLHAHWRWFVSGRLPAQAAVLLIPVMGWLANFLPWMLVSRCLFSYHYQPASVFSFGVLAWWLASAMSGPGEAPSRWHLTRPMVAVVMLFGVLAAWLYWLPLALGYPIGLDEFYQRMWLDSWI